jgi:hypothetical protein
MTEYMQLVTETNWCSDRALGQFLKFGRYSKKPLDHEFLEFYEKNKEIQQIKPNEQIKDKTATFNIPIHVIYAGEDWMDKDHTLESMKKLGLMEKFNMNFGIIENCGH